MLGRNVIENYVRLGSAGSGCQGGDRGHKSPEAGVVPNLLSTKGVLIPWAERRHNRCSYAEVTYQPPIKQEGAETSRRYTKEGLGCHADSSGF